MKIHTLLLPLLPLALGLQGCGGGEAPSGKPKNVLLISIDTLRPDHMGCYGHEGDTSPFLDSLAENGTLFEDVTSAAPWTLPGHATMLTGLYPSHHAVKNHDNQLAAERWTLAEELAELGFENFAVVNSWNIGEERFQLHQGVPDENFAYVDEMEEDFKNFRRNIANRGDEILDTATKMLQRRTGQPFSMFLHFYDVHTDFTPDDEWREKFVSPYAGGLNGRTGQLVGIRRRKDSLTEADIRFLKEMYNAELAQLDHKLKQFFSWLDEEGILDETLVVITSDHGEEYFEHGSVLHGTTHYQEVLAIPLILHGPGVPSGKRIPDPVSLIDVVPTILGLVGATPHMEHDGLDLTSYWEDPASIPEDRVLFGEADHNNLGPNGEKVIDVLKMVRVGGKKYILDNRDGSMEMFDLVQDPLEKQNLVDSDPELAAELRARLDAFLATEVAPVMIEATSAEEDAKLEQLGY